MAPISMSRVSTAVGTLLDRMRLLPTRPETTADIHPTDAAAGSVPGPSPVRIAVVGERARTSAGVLSHELGVIGFLARSYSAGTGSGVRWSTTEVASGRLRDVPPTLDSAGLGDADVLVLMIGLTDARLRIPPTIWEQQLRRALNHLRRSLVGTTWILIAEIPGSGDERPGAHQTPAAAHAGVLNARTTDVVTRFSRVATVSDPIGAVTRSPQSRAARFSMTHRAWGEALSHAAAEAR